MASWSVNNNTITLTLTVTETATNTAANTSDVSWRLDVTCNSGYFTSRAISWSVNVGGIAKSSVSTCTASQGQTITLGSGSGKITHNADGTKTITCTAHAERSGAWSVLWDALNISQSLSLTPLARYSTPSVSPSVVVCSGQSSDRFSISFYCASSSYYYLLTVTIPSVTELYRTTLHGTAGSYLATLYTPPRDTVQYFGSSETTKTIQFNLVTYTDSTMSTVLGQTATQATIKASQQYHAPTLSNYSITEANADLTAVNVADADVYGVLSRKTIQVTASGNYGASISSTSVTAQNGSVYTALPRVGGDTFRGTLEDNTAGVFTVRATDSRGFTSTITRGSTSNYIPYIPPTIIARVQRTAPTEPNIVATFKGVVYNGSIGSSATSFSVSYKYKEKDASTWTSSANTLTWTESETGKVEYNEDFQLAEEFAYNKQYLIQFTLSDGFSSVVSEEAIIFVGIPVYSWGSNHFDIYGTLNIHDRTDPDNVYSVISAGEKAVRVTCYDVISSSLSVGDNLFTCTIPADATEILAVIPHRCTPKSAWDTIGYLGEVKVTNGSWTISVHTIGSRAQAYAIGYVVIWR